MALPTLLRTWQHNVNNAQTAQGSAKADITLWWLNTKNAMIGFASNPWAVDYSCNSVTAGTKGDAVDRWTTVANLVYNNAGSAHSWMVLKQVGIASTYEVCFDLSNNGASGNTFTVAVSPSAGFTGGSTTARPTATDEIVKVANTTGINVTTDLAFRWSVQQTTDGACTRIFAFAAGTQIVWASFEVPVVTVTANWTNPSFAIWTATPTATVANWTNGALLSIRAGSSPANLSCNMSCEGSFSNALGPVDTNYGQVANELDSNWPFWQIGIVCGTVGSRGRHGFITDMWFGSNAIPSGDSYPATGTTGQFAQIGMIITPWNGGAVNTS